MVLGSNGIAVAQPPLAQLDTGAYPTAPALPLGVAGSMQAGARIEGQRMADFVVGPWEVDPALVGEAFDGAVVIDGPDAVSDVFSDDIASVAIEHNVVSGFDSSRAADQKLFRAGALRFADAATAASATAGFNDAAATTGAPVTIPGHPDTRAVTLPYEDSKGVAWTVVRSFTAHGPYSLYQRAAVEADVAGAGDIAASLVAGTLDRQMPLIDQFRPTDPAALALLPVDPTGLLARTLPAPPSELSAMVPGSYGPHGALFFEADPNGSAAMFGEAGVSQFVLGATKMYEAVNPQGAQRLIDGYRTLLLADGVLQEPVPSLAGSHCVDTEDPDSPRFVCLAAVDRYGAVAESDGLLDAQQRLAAQYVMLTRP